MMFFDGVCFCEDNVIIVLFLSLYFTGKIGKTSDHRKYFLPSNPFFFTQTPAYRLFLSHLSNLQNFILIVFYSLPF